MIFTQEQIDEIEQKLAKRGAKDTQLPPAKAPLTGDESIAIVQERENRLVPIGSIVNTDGGIFNVSEYLKVKTEADTSVILTLSEAIEACPSRAKKAGQIITFIDKDKEWQRYQYQGYNAGNWNQLTLWKDLNNVSEDMPVSEDVMTFNITEYMPRGSKYKQAIWAGIYTIDGITPVSQYRVILGCDASLGIVEGVDMDASDTLAIIDIDTDEVASFSYILFVGNSIDGYRYQTEIPSYEDVPDWIAKAFGNNSSYIAANIESLERRVNAKLNNKVDKIQGKGLSTNDYTTAEKTKLSNLPTASELTTALAGKQDTINDLAAIRNGATLGATAYQKPATGIPATDLASDVQTDLAAIDGIEEVIPTQASSSNQLADKNFVNSSIATNTANYISDNGQPFQSVEDLEAYSGVLTNNDYAFVVGVDSVGNTTYSRYKYNASTQQWALEYVLNNSSFTAEQWAAINSSITSGLVAKLSALPTNSELTTLLNGKADVGRVEDIEDALSVVESETADATDYTTETTSVSTDNITINPVAVRKSPIYSVYKQGGGQESIEGVFSPGYTDGSYILNVQIAQAGTVKINSIRTRYYSGYYAIVYFYFTPIGGEKVKVAEIAKASAGTATGNKYEEPTVSVNAPGAGVLSIELWLYDIDTYNTIPAFFWMEHERSSVVYYAITSISFEQSSLTGFVNNGAYNSTTKKIELKHDSDILVEIDATDIFDSDNYYDKNDVDGLLAGKADSAAIEAIEQKIPAQASSSNKLVDWNSLASVATSGSYNDLSDKPTIPDITGKADKVSNATNGNFAALDNNGNLIDSGHKHSDYLTQHQDLTNYVQKSQTAGLLKNDGTVDTNTYLTQHQDISGKEDITPIEAVVSGTTAINAAVNTYYEVAGEVGALAITLPTPTDLTKLSMVVVHLTAGTTPNVVIGSTATIDYSAAYDISAGKEYEINCLFNGDKWVVADMEVV